LIASLDLILSKQVNHHFSLSFAELSCRADGEFLFVEGISSALLP
jgi:hypothetical protein